MQPICSKWLTCLSWRFNDCKPAIFGQLCFLPDYYINNLLESVTLWELLVCSYIIKISYRLIIASPHFWKIFVLRRRRSAALLGEADQLVPEEESSDSQSRKNDEDRYQRQDVLLRSENGLKSIEEMELNLVWKFFKKFFGKLLWQAWKEWCAIRWAVFEKDITQNNLSL